MQIFRYHIDAAEQQRELNFELHSCKRLKLLRKAGCLQIIQNSAPSISWWCQFDIQIMVATAMAKLWAAEVLMENAPGTRTTQM